MRILKTAIIMLITIGMIGLVTALILTPTGMGVMYKALLIAKIAAIVLFTFAITVQVYETVRG